MTTRFDPDEFTATDMRIALNEVFPEATYGAIPVIDQYDALATYLAFDDGTRAEAPLPKRANSGKMQVTICWFLFAYSFLYGSAEGGPFDGGKGSPSIFRK